MSGLDDLQADLDEIADEAAKVHVYALKVNGGWIDVSNDIADRLRNLLTDRDLDVPPLTSEIIAWLEADPEHIVEWWFAIDNAWVTNTVPLDDWRHHLTTHGDQRQHGYRLRVREPATERVRLDQLLGRTLPGETTPVNHFKWVYGDQRFEWTIHGATWQPFDVAPDGTVEVLKDAP